MTRFSLASAKEIKGASPAVRLQWARYYYILNRGKGKMKTIETIAKKTGFSKAFIKNDVIK